MMRQSTFVACVAGLVTAGCAQKPVEIKIEDFVRMRCSQSGAPAITAWKGTMYTNVEGAEQEALFGLTGMNIASCFMDKDGMWSFSSRELMYYTDPDDTNKPLTTWFNKEINETVTVMHVANSPVQNPFGMGDDTMDAATVAGGSVLTQSSDINLFYPNVLAGDAKFADYAPQTMYEGGEFFKFFTSMDDFTKASDALPKTYFGWDRSGQWLPWMKMGNRPGTTFASCTGSRVEFNELPKFMQEDIKTRLPLYLTPPGCYEDAKPSTSWTYFRDNFDAYLAGKQFPVEAPAAEVKCKYAPVHPKSSPAQVVV